MVIAQLSREEKGRLIEEQPNQIQQVNERFYKVASQSREIMYDVIRRENGSWLCNCLDFHYRNLRCKHIIACQIREQLRERVRENIVIQPIEITACVFCQSTALKKFGLRHNKYGDIQRFLCSTCRRTFSVNVGFERMKHNAQAITAAMQLYFSGESLRNTSRTYVMQAVLS
ncbi:MAG: SWIM zinc finger family protein [Candidatus Bathyarchaeia archaeon]